MTGKARKLLLAIAACLVLSALVSLLVSFECGRMSLRRMSRVLETLAENGAVPEREILDALKDGVSRAPGGEAEGQFLAKYGYGSRDFAGRTFLFTFLCLTALFAAAFGACLSFARAARRARRQRVDALTEYLEKVNVQAPGTVMQAGEDEFSHLRDEIYKTVTALYQTREAALRAKRGYADNLENIAHQLKTPLTAASLSAQLAEAQRPDAHTRAIQKQLARIKRLTEALLTLSQIDAGALALEDADVDVYTALSLASDNLSDLLSASGVSVEIPEKGCVTVRGDMEWTMQALMNLMKNCMEHSPRGGTVHCDYDENPLYVTLLIWDEGSGFDPSDIPRLFERFYRGRNAGGGIGIGLSLTKAIVELQNGSIAARNRPGGGACFEIRFYRHRAVTFPC